MASVLAIVSKALFEKMVPKDVSLGTVVDVSEYKSSNKAFDGLADGGAVFMVTVRPPDEKLWLVAILESPKKKGEKWTSSAANTTPLTDITGAIKKLEFASGTGIKAKKGALGMSLQTPRELTDEDVTLLRGFVSSKPASGKKVSASDAYRSAVDEVVGKKKPGKLGGLRLERARSLKELEAWETKQVKASVGNADIEEIANGENDEWATFTIVDVVDTESEDVLYQMHLFGYGDGCVYENETTNVIVDICQHGFDPRKPEKTLVRDFARAWAEGAKRLKLWEAHIDFDDDEGGDEDDEDDDDDDDDDDD